MILQSEVTFWFHTIKKLKPRPTWGFLFQPTPCFPKNNKFNLQRRVWHKRGTQLVVYFAFYSHITAYFHWKKATHDILKAGDSRIFSVKPQPLPASSSNPETVPVTLFFFFFWLFLCKNIDFLNFLSQDTLLNHPFLFRSSANHVARNDHFYFQPCWNCRSKIKHQIISSSHLKQVIVDLQAGYF